MKRCCARNCIRIRVFALVFPQTHEYVYTNAQCMREEYVKSTRCICDAYFNASMRISMHMHTRIRAYANARTHACAHTCD